MIDKAGAHAKLKSIEYPLAEMYVPPNILGIGRQTMMQGKVKLMENQLLLLASLYWAAVLAVLGGVCFQFLNFIECLIHAWSIKYRLFTKLNA